MSKFISQNPAICALAGAYVLAETPTSIANGQLTAIRQKLSYAAENNVDPPLMAEIEKVQRLSQSLDFETKQDQVDAVRLAISNILEQVAA